MTIKQLMKGSALSALAAAIAITALPTEAAAQNRGRDRGERQEQRAERQEQRAMRNDTRQIAPREDLAEARAGEDRRDGGRQWTRPNDGTAQAAPAPQQRQTRDWARAQPVPAPVAQAPVAQERGQERGTRDWNRSDRRTDDAQDRSGRDWNRNDRRTETGQESGSRDWNRNDRRVEGNRDGARDWNRNSTYTGDRNRTYRDGYRDANRHDRYENRDIRRDGYRDGYRDANRRSRYHDGRRWHDYDRWDRYGWRDNSRYDWYGYRSHNRSMYRMGHYYSPYRNYSYRRLSIGVVLDNLLFGNRYWINDPWRYRLPDVYGPYRWVRYYDDVLLVDIYSGEVVDVIHDFFW